MDNPNKDHQEGDKTPVSPEDWAKAQEQIANLNKGIASYRDEVTTWKSKAETLEGRLSKLEEKIEFEAEDDPDLQLAPEDQKKLDEWTKKKGFVTKEEFEAEKSRIQADAMKSIENTAVSEFLEKHKEYDDDVEWAKVQAEFNLYKTPTSLDSYRKLLNKIHNDLNGNTSKAKEDGKAQARAELITKGRLSLGGGSQGGSGNDGIDVETLQKRYPNLSRDQIEEKLSEIRSLFPKK